MMFFEKDGFSKGWPWQSVARFLRVVDQCVQSARPRGRLGELFLIVFYLVNIKNRGSFCELRFKSRGEVSALRRSVCAA